MLKTETFSDILNQLHQSETSSANTIAEWETTLDPYGFSQIMAQTYVSFKQPTKWPKAYKAIKTSAIKTVVKADHIMSDAQLNAYNLIYSLCPNLMKNFSSKQLKSAYRVCLLKSHPDQGGQAETFFKVKESYQILLALT